MSGDELPPLKRCRDCGEEKPFSEFWSRKASPDGRSLYCTDCFGVRNAAARLARAEAEGRAMRPRTRPPEGVPPDMRWCGSCDRVLPLEDFVRNRSTRTGYGSYCRPCQNAKVAE